MNPSPIDLIKNWYQKHSKIGYSSRVFNDSHVVWGSETAMRLSLHVNGS